MLITRETKLEIVKKHLEDAVTQPFLNLLHGNIVCQEQACAAVAKIMEPDFTQSVFL